MAAIHDDPESDDPRLAWADWLTAQGNPWGEVVRTAVGLAARSRPPSRALLAAQRQHLAAGLGPLAAVLSDDVDDLAFERRTLAGGVLVRAVPAALVADPRWRGVRWLHARDGGSPQGLLRDGRLDQLVSLRNLPIDAVAELAAWPVAARLRALSAFADGAHRKHLTPALLEPFGALERFALHDLGDDDDDDGEAGAERVHGWLARSKLARQRLRRIGVRPGHQIAMALAERPRFPALEAVRFDSLELVYAGRGAQLFFFATSAWLEGKIAAMKIPTGAITTVEIDARVVDRHKDGRAAMKALAARLGARLTIHAKPRFRTHLERWDWD
ncbi:TIGR02996 domain-containing protein [Nannocystis exedens]|uniref:TIGR02996 domain-containing protein n=1 Tax=Nannocystis exedens TaxID=54 RepID=UPI00210F0FC6|nr:TIGR02996 domain-containing protein [Nannocystis exedens]